MSLCCPKSDTAFTFFFLYQELISQPHACQTSAYGTELNPRHCFRFCHFMDFCPCRPCFCCLSTIFYILLSKSSHIKTQANFRVLIFLLFNVIAIILHSGLQGDCGFKAICGQLYLIAIGPLLGHLGACCAFLYLTTVLHMHPLCCSEDSGEVK